MRERQIRRFQCCICASLLATFFISMAISISFWLSNGDDEVIPENTTVIQISIPDRFVLLELPLQGKKIFIFFIVSLINGYFQMSRYPIGPSQKQQNSFVRMRLRLVRKRWETKTFTRRQCLHPGLIPLLFAIKEQSVLLRRHVLHRNAVM